MFGYLSMINAHSVTPYWNPTPIRPATPAPRMTKKQHYLETDCRHCGNSMALTYPTSIAFWKFDCPSCRMNYSIEIIGNKKCLVYQNKGRKTVERIGISNVKSHFYRAKCHTCETVAIVPEHETGIIQSCQQCHLDFTIHKEPPHPDFFYQTVVVHNGQPVTYRDQVQILTGYILHKGQAFFLDEDIPKGSEREWMETVTQQEKELETLKEKTQKDQDDLLRIHAHTLSLAGELKTSNQERASLVLRLSELEKTTKKLTEEKHFLTNRLNDHGQLVRDLDHNRNIVQTLQRTKEKLERQLKTINLENQQLKEKQTLQGEMVRNIDTLIEKSRKLESENQRLLNNQTQATDKSTKHQLDNSANLELVRRADRLSAENNAFAKQINSYRNQLSTLEKRLKNQPTSNPKVDILTKKLEDHIRENNHLKNQLQGLELTLASKVQHPSEHSTKDTNKEDWYCEEEETFQMESSLLNKKERHILGIKGQPTPSRIKTALRRRIKKYHPDRVASMGVKLRELAHEKTLEINQAYATLMTRYANA